MDQARIRQIHRYAGVTPHQDSDRVDGSIETKGDLKDPTLDVRKHGLWRTSEAAEQVTRFGEDRLAGDEGSRKRGHHLDAGRVISFASVEQCDDDTRVEKDGFHRRPKPRKWVRFDPRSGFPDSNAPRPTIVLLPRRGKSCERLQTTADELRIREPSRFAQARDLAARLYVESGVDERSHVLQASLCHTGSALATNNAPAVT